MTLDSFLAHPLTPEGLVRLRAECDRDLLKGEQRARRLSLLGVFLIIALTAYHWQAGTVFTPFTIVTMAMVLSIPLIALYLSIAELTSSLDTRLAERAQLDPATPEDCAAALAEARKHPEVEQFRQTLLRNGREYLTVWEQQAIMRFERDRAKTEGAEQARASCQQFMTADVLSNTTTQEAV